MNDDFMKAYKDFQGHFSELNSQHLRVYAKEARKYLSSIQREAKKVNVHPNYYILEFLE